MSLVPSRANPEHFVGVGELPFLRYMRDSVGRGYSTRPGHVWDESDG